MWKGTEELVSERHLEILCCWHWRSRMGHGVKECRRLWKLELQKGGIAFSPGSPRKIQALQIFWAKPLKTHLRHLTARTVRLKVGCFLFFLIFIVVQLQLYAFSPHPSTPPHPSRTPLPSPPPLSPLILSMCLYSSSCKPLSPLSPPHSPVAIVTLFLISMSLVIFCLLFSLVDYVLM